MDRFKKKKRFVRPEKWIVQMAVFFSLMVLFASWGPAIYGSSAPVPWEITDKYCVRSTYLHVPEAYFIVITSTDGAAECSAKLQVCFSQWEALNIGDHYSYPRETVTNWEFYFEGKTLSDH